MGHCLVGASLICGLVMCAGCPRCSCHVSELGREDVAGMMGQTGISLDTERTVVRNCSFSVWLGNPTMAFICPVWLRVIPGWLHCSCGWSAVVLGRLPGDFLWGL